MKLKLILMILIGATISSCGTKIKYLNTHVDLVIPSNCDQFERFTEEEKDSMTEDVGRKIYRNNNACEARQARIDELVEAHNKVHAEKKQ